MLKVKMSQPTIYVLHVDYMRLQMFGGAKL
jgi:hypothetical protein